METLDIISYSNKLPETWNYYANQHKNFIAFKLRERVPLEALNFKWIVSTSHLASRFSDRKNYPSGINYDFNNKVPMYNVSFDFHQLGDHFASMKAQENYDACMSYLTMPFLHHTGLLSLDYDQFYTIVEDGRLKAFVEIPYDVYITALHVFNVTGIDRTNIDLVNTYITKDDVDKLSLPLDQVRIVAEDGFDINTYINLHYMAYGNGVETHVVDDIYHYLTGNKLEQEPEKLLEYEQL